MPTATKTSPSAEHRRLVQRREEAYAAVQEVKRRHKAHDAETQEMRREISMRPGSHPEEFEGRNLKPRAGTEAAKLRDQIMVRMNGPNPHPAELDAAISEFHEHDIALREWSMRNVEARAAEFEADGHAAVEQIRKGFEMVLRGRELYAVTSEAVREVILSTDTLTGRISATTPALTSGRG